jgi:flagellar protein FlaF
LQEAVIRKGAAQYQRTSEAGLSGRDTECAAFNLVIRDLSDCTQGASRLRALGRNHTLWSILVKDLSLGENALPAPLKSELIGLGLWAMRYSTLAMLKDLPLDPLVDVNRNVLDGLLNQGRGGDTASAPFQASRLAV